MIANEFGKKIGGSKRDLWRARGLQLEDLEDMNSEEQKAYVKKDNIWPKPDYKALKESGVPIEVIYFRKSLRDAIEVKPIHSIAGYISAVQEVRAFAENITTVENIKGSFERYIAAGFATGRTQRGYVLTDKGYEVGSKVFRAVQMTAQRCLYEIRKKQFLYSPEEIVLDEYRFVKCTGESNQFSNGYNGISFRIPGGAGYFRGIEYEKVISFPPQTVLAIKNGKFINAYMSEDEAKADILSKVQPTEKAPSARKQKYLYQMLSDMKQSNLEPFIKSGDDFIADFGFYGGEFGTWLSNDDRQKNLDMSYVAFKNLAAALDIKLSSVSIGGRLSIAFGARGRGNAMAHYEPLRQVINLTKWKGAGSLAHEYGHALDHILGGGLMDEHIGGLQAGICSKSVSCNIQKAVAGVLEAMTIGTDRRTTKYYANSKAFDRSYAKDGGYWSSGSEMFARAFACYVKDKLAAMEIVDDYLCGHAESAVDIIHDVAIKAYPEGDERIRINQAIDNLLSIWKNEGLLV